MPPPALTHRHQRSWLAATVLLVVVVAGRLVAHAEGANGPWYWKWRWSDLDPLRVYPAMALGLVPFALSQLLFERRGRVGAPLGLLMSATLLFALANTAVREPDFSVSTAVAAIVENHTVTGYLTEARRHDRASWAEAASSWLREFPERSPSLRLHNRNKPPGGVLYFTAMLHLFGERAALVGGLLVGVLTTLAIPACFLLQRAMGVERDAAFHASGYLALCPSLVVFFPQFDALYALFAAILLALWAAATERGAPALALAFGLSLAASCFFTYNLLALGAFLGAYWLWHVARGALPFRTGLRQVAIAVAGFAGVYALLWITTGYDAVRTFLVAYANQQGLERILQRPYPATIAYDLLDFMLGSSYVAGALAAYALASPRHLGEQWKQRYVLVLLCLGQIALVAVLGLLKAETARVWAFLLPLLMAPVGLALSRFTARQRLAFYACAWVALAVVCQSMDFMIYKKRKRRVAPTARADAALVCSPPEIAAPPVPRA